MNGQGGSRGSWFLAALVVLLALGSLTGCAATSEYMDAVETPRPLARVADMATVVFIRPSWFARSIGTTLLDGRGTFLGDSLPESHFAVLLPPGPHVFIAWAENTAALQAMLAPGRVYFVEVSPRLGAISARMQLLAVTRRSESWAKVDAWMAETTQLIPVARAGQQYLASRAVDVQERIRRANEALHDYDAEELADRTIRPEDGR